MKNYNNLTGTCQKCNDGAGIIFHLTTKRTLRVNTTSSKHIILEEFKGKLTLKIPVEIFVRFIDNLKIISQHRPS